MKNKVGGSTQHNIMVTIYTTVAIWFANRGDINVKVTEQRT